MTTSASEPTPTAESAAPDSHHARTVAESFGNDAGRYDRARPSYPADLINQLVAASPGPRVLDVGCGTGIAARQFQAAGCQVLGVEPDARMAEFARQQGLAVEVSTFETWDDAGREFDLVVAGQAWHWVDPVAGAAKAATVLRPDGRLSMFWHDYQPPRAVAEVLAQFSGQALPTSRMPGQQPTRTDTVRYQPLIDRAADGVRDVGGFGAPAQWRFDWERSYTRNEWLDVLPTFGGLTLLPADKLAELQGAVGAAIDALGGSFLMPFTTVALVVARDSVA